MTTLAAEQPAPRRRRGGGLAKLTPAQRTAMRERRAAGAKLDELAADFEISNASVSVLCAGVAKVAPTPPPPPPVAVAVLELVAAVNHLPLDWHLSWQRGRPTAPLAVARRAAMVAMQAAGLSRIAIRRALGGRDLVVPRGQRTEAAAQATAAEVLERLAAAQVAA